MARCLIVGCGCRGRELARGLRDAGHAVRATTRDPERAAVLRADGLEAVVGDPDRVMTLAAALEHVGVLYVLLGSAVGPPEAIAELHGSRLDMLLLRALDSTVRGIVYEAAGTVPREILSAGAARVRRFCEGSRIPWALIEADPDDWAVWAVAAQAASARVLGG